MTISKLAVTKAILKTLVYADIFDYPLTKEELFHYLLYPHPINNQLFEQALLHRHITKKGKYYFLSTRNVLIKKRTSRETMSNKKIASAKKIARILALLPSIKFIGLSGALAMKNADNDDDIDLFIITATNRLWTTRILVLCMLQLFGRRRGRADKTGKDKVCLNMLITEQALDLPRIKRDIYLAHEIVQMQQLINKEGMYERFLQAHVWVKKYMYNSVDKKVQKNNIYNDKKNALSFSEDIAKKIQLWSIMKHQTREIVSDVLLAFHPFDYRKYILKEYKKRIQQYGI